jgi:hypothetical protein
MCHLSGVAIQMRKTVALCYFAIVFLLAWWPWNGLLIVLGMARLRALEDQRSSIQPPLG